MRFKAVGTHLNGMGHARRPPGSGSMTRRALTTALAAAALMILTSCTSTAGDPAVSLTPQWDEPLGEEDSSISSSGWLYPFVLWKARLGMHDDFERLVLEFRIDDNHDSDDGPLRLDVFGCAVDCLHRGSMETSSSGTVVEGAASLRVSTHSAGAAMQFVGTLEVVGPPTPALPLFGQGVIRQVELSDNYEGVLEVLIGLDHAAPLRIGFLSDPERLVIDVWTSPAVPPVRNCGYVEATPEASRCLSWDSRGLDELVIVGGWGWRYLGAGKNP